MKRFPALAAASQELAHFSSLEDNGPGQQSTAGVIPIVATDSAARADGLARVPAFLARFLGN